MEKLTILQLVMPAKALVLQWRGEVTARDPGLLLTPFLDSILEGKDLTRVALDFSLMDFMNSSTLVPIVAFIKRASSRQVVVELRYNSEVSWQRVSHQCMTVMCKKVPHVEITYKST